MKNKLVSLFLSSLVALPGFAASTTTTTKTYTEVSKEEPQVYLIKDSSIRKSLDREIDMRAELDDDVSFSVKNGVVTLRGVVDNNLENKQAVDVAYSIKGVQHVVDKLISEEAGTKTYTKTQDVTSYKETIHTSTTDK